MRLPKIISCRAILIAVLILIVVFLFWALADGCNVASISLRGSMVNYIPPEAYNDQGSLISNLVSSQNIIAQLKQADEDDSITAVIFEVDSYGGDLVAGKEISDAVKKFSKPLVVYVSGAADSAAYYSISPASMIFANSYSDLGSIAITMSYLENVDKNRKEGLTFIDLTTGKFKNAGDPNKPLTSEERALFIKQLNASQELMVQDIAKNRNIPVEKLKLLADGRSFTATEAKSNSLINEIGNIYDAINWIEGKIGQKANICE